LVTISGLALAVGAAMHYIKRMPTEQITREAIDLPLRERVSLAQRLWESIERGVADAEERQVIAEAVRRDEELTTGLAVGREHGEVMQAARQRLGCA
jgi:hypothetical protein